MANKLFYAAILLSIVALSCHAYSFSKDTTTTTTGTDDTHSSNSTTTTTTDDSHATTNTTTHDDTHDDSHDTHDDSHDTHDDSHDTHDTHDDHHDAHDDHHDSHGHTFSAGSEKRAFCFLVFFIVIFTLLFEHMEHKLKHLTPKLLEPVLNQAFSELTVLGFIGVVSLVITEKYDALHNHSLMNKLSIIFFDDPEHLEHRFHEVHYNIFFLMMGFIGMVCFYLAIASNLRKRYHTFEICTNEMYRFKDKEWKYPASRKFDVLQYLFTSDLSLSEHQVFRNRFVDTCNILKKKYVTDHDPNATKFNFGEYRARMVISTIVKMLKLQWSDWLAVALVLFFFAAIFNAENPTASSVMFVLLSIANLVHVVAWVHVCMQAKKQLLPCRKEELKVLTPGNSYPQGNVMPARTSLHDPEQIPLYLNLSYDNRETAIEKFFYGVPANQHERLLWGQNKHSHVMIALLRCSSFLNVIAIAAAMSFGEKTLFASPISGLICLVCYLLTFLLIAIGIDLYSFVTSIEKMKDTKCVEEICHASERKKRAVVWEALIGIERILSSSNTHHDHAHKVEPATEQEKEMVENLKSAIERFKKPNQQDLDYSAAEAVMRDTWPTFTEVDTDDLTKFLELMDLDKSGTISTAEFVAVTLEQYRSTSMGTLGRANKIVDDLFERYDKDKSGSLDLNELEEVFAGKKFKYFDIHQLLADMDEDRSGSITTDEFKKYVKASIGHGGAGHASHHDGHH